MSETLLDENNPKHAHKGLWVPAELRKLGLSVIESCLLSIIDHYDHGAPDYCYASNRHLATLMELSESRISFYITKFKRMELLEEVHTDGRRRKLRVLKENWYSKKELCVKTRRQTACDSGVSKKELCVKTRRQTTCFHDPKTESYRENEAAHNCSNKQLSKKLDDDDLTRVRASDEKEISKEISPEQQSASEEISPELRTDCDDMDAWRAELEKAVLGETAFKAPISSPKPSAALSPKEERSGSLGCDMYEISMVDGSTQIISGGDVFTAAVLHRKDWTREEILDALKSIKKSCPKIRDWVKYLDGVIKNNRLLKDSLQKKAEIAKQKQQEKICKSKHSTRKYSTTKPNTSESATGERICLKSLLTANGVTWL